VLTNCAFLLGAYLVLELGFDPGSPVFSPPDFPFLFFLFRSSVRSFFLLSLSLSRSPSVSLSRSLCSNLNLSFFDSLLRALSLSLYFSLSPFLCSNSICTTDRRGGGLGSRPQKMYGERLGDGVEYHLMSPTPRR